MRSSFYKDLCTDLDGEVVIIEDEEFRHLTKVCRVKVLEKILLISGNGLKASSIVNEIHKKKIYLKIEKVYEETNSAPFDILIGKLKKDAMDEVFRIACELGVKQIFLAPFEFAQSYKLNSKRIQTILVNALKQSNFCYLPEVIELDNSYSDILNDYEFCAVAHLEENHSKIQIKNFKNSLLIIGPEGGLSTSDIETLNQNQNIYYFYHDGPIMRAPTALSFFASRMYVDA